MNKVISIAGSSGVGKTTISKILKIIYGSEAVIVSGDDLHKWERGDEMWNRITHFNPDANNLIKGVYDISNLKNNRSVYRNVYDHDTGKFIRDVLINPKKIIINEGLHSLYDCYAEYSDINIFVSTGYSLKKKWKVARDTEKRGYSVEQVLDVINKRIPDEEKYILKQKSNADINIRFLDNFGKIELDIEVLKRTKKIDELCKKISDTYSHLSQFLNVSKLVSEDPNISYNSGGNMSCRINQCKLITSSGKDFSDVNMFSGFVVIGENGEKYFSDERPSMEFGIHKMYSQSVLHTHPIYLNCLLCSENADEYIVSMAQELQLEDWAVVDYTKPGESLKSVLEAKFGTNMPNYLFLKNHGLFVCRKSLYECFEETIKINFYCQELLNKLNCSFVKYVDYDSSNVYDFLFPDAVVLKNENRLVNSYLADCILNCGLTPRFLTQKECMELESMEEEKYRRKII